MTADHPTTRAARPLSGWTAAALAALAAVAVLDAAIGEGLIVIGTFVLAPLALALIGRPRHVAVVGVVASALAIAGGFWDDFAFTADHLVRIGVVTIGSALAVLGAHARRSAERERSRMTVLSALGRTTEVTTLDEVLDRIADATVPAIADLTWLDLKRPGEEPPTRRLLTRSAHPDAGAVEAWLAGLPLAAGSPTRKALEEGTSVFIPDFDARDVRGMTATAEDAERVERLRLRSVAIVPLRARGETIGTLGVAVGPSERRYVREDLTFVEVLAGRVSLAIANAGLVSELSSTRERLDRILDALAEAVTVHDANGTTVYANEAAVELLGARDHAEVLAASPGELAGRFIITREDGSPVGVEDFPGRRLVEGERSPEPLLTRSVHVATGREYWILTKARLVSDTDGSPLAVNVLEDVTEAKDAELRQRFLASAGEVLASTLEHEAALQEVASLAVPSLADWCAVDLLDRHGRLERVAIAHEDPGKVAAARELQRRFPPDPAAPSGVYEVVRTGRPEIYPDIPDELLAERLKDPEELAVVREVGMRSAMIVPMTAGDETLGAMTFVSAESGRSFGEDDFAFAQDLARRAATAVQNGRLYAEQARVAATLQRSLLPDKLPQVPGWEAGASYVAGDDGAEVGGDFYDIVPTRRGHIVILGDVTGKGVEAAALTALVRHSAQTAARFDLGPAAVLELVDDVLRSQPRLSPVSMVCALIEETGDGARVTLSSGGHPLPLLKREGETRQVGAHEVLLGVAPGGQWTEHVLEARPGDALLFYTDGVIDAPGPGARFGERRLQEVTDEAAPEPHAILRAIDRALRDFGVTAGGDDRAMLALRYTGRRDGATRESLARLAA